MGVTAGIVEFGHFDNAEQEGAPSRELKESRLTAPNQRSINAALQGPRADVICGFGAGRAVYSSAGFLVDIEGR